MPNNIAVLMLSAFFILVNASATYCSPIEALNGPIEAEKAEILSRCRRLAELKNATFEDKEKISLTESKLKSSQKRLRSLLVYQLRLKTTLSKSSALSLYKAAWQKFREVKFKLQETVRSRLAGASGSDKKARVWGYGDGLLRIAFTEKGAALDVLTAQSPNLSESDYGTPELPKNFHPGQSRTVARLTHLGTTIAKTDPDYIALPKDGDIEWARWIAKKHYSLLVDEYLLVAATGTIISPRTGRPASPEVRIQLAGNAISVLASYLKNRGKKSPLDTLLRPSSVHTETSAQLENYLKNWMDYQVVTYLDSGIEPEPSMYFLSVARVMRQQEEQLNDWYNNKYLGKGVWNTSLDQLLRANGFDTSSPDTNRAAVERRMKWFKGETDAAAKAFTKAAETPNPDDLSKNHLRLLRAYGFIAENHDKRKIYVVSQSKRRLQARVNHLSEKVDLPGASWLSVITPKNIAITALSVIVPEACAGTLAAALEGAGAARAIVMGARVLAETAVGTYVDATTEYVEKGKVEWHRLLSESLFLGGGMQIVSVLNEKAVQSAFKKIIASERQSRFVRLLQERPALREAAEKSLLEAMGLTIETGTTAMFQHFVQEQDLDMNGVLSILLQGYMARKIGQMHDDFKWDVSLAELKKNIVPDWLKEHIARDKELARELHKAVKRRLKAEQEALNRFQDVTDAQGERTASTVFSALIKGELSWSDLKRVYATNQENMRPLMEEIKKLRDNFFQRFVRDARRAANREVLQRFDAERKKLQERNAPQSEIDTLNKRELYELALIYERPIAPGSGDPTSDIDRSASSIYVRRHLRAIYELHTRLSADGDFPTSAKAFDVNEYINVFPSIIENRKYAEELRKVVAQDDGLPELSHGEAMEALSIAGAMNHMTPEQATIFHKNLIRRREERIANKEVSGKKARKLLEKQIRYAQASLAKSNKELSDLKKKIAQERGLDARGAEVDRLARDALYDNRMADVNDLWFQLSQKPKDSSEAVELRALIDRKLSQAMRDGIETYCQPTGLDIVVNMVQQAVKRNPDGTVLLGEDKKPVKMKIADRLMDPNFTLEKELRMYDRSDINSLLNDQIMFMAEHVNGYQCGSETAYEAGRALGKYLERSFLALKLQGLDINQVVKRSDYDSTKRLLLFAQELVRNKHSPKAVADVLKKYSLKSPPSAENGLKELFRLMERVIPGMKDLSTPSLLGRGKPGESEIHHKQWYYTHRNWNIQKEALSEAGGAALLLAALNNIVETTKLELTALQSSISKMEEYAKKYLHTDWQLVAQLEEREEGASFIYRSLPFYPRGEKGKPSLSDKLGKELNGLNEKLSQLRNKIKASSKVDKAALYKRLPDYARKVDRLGFLKRLLATRNKERIEAHKRALQEKLLANLVLTGKWKSGAPGAAAFFTQIEHQGEVVEMKIDWTQRDKDGPHFYVRAYYRHGRLRGFWEDNNQAKITVNSDTKVPVRGQWDATVSTDGKSFELAKSMHDHPLVSTLWAERTFQRQNPVRRYDPTAFITYEDRPIPQTDQSLSSFQGQKPKEGKGRLYLLSQQSDGSRAYQDFDAYKAGTNDWVGYSSYGNYVDLPAGTYDIRLAGGRTLAKNQVVRTGKITVALAGQRGRVSVRIDSPDGKVPRGSYVTIFKEGRSLYRTVSGLDKFTRNLDPGKYDVAMTVGGKTLKRSVTVEAGREAFFHMHCGGIRPKVTDIHGRKINARFSIYDSKNAKSPLATSSYSRDLAFPPGNYTLSAHNAASTGSVIWRPNINVKQRKWTNVAIKLGRLSWKGLGDKETVTIKHQSGVWIGLPRNRSRLDLSAGTYVIKRFQGGRVREEKQLEIQSGKKKVIDFED